MKTDVSSSAGSRCRQLLRSVGAFFRKELMLGVALAAALLSFFITPPSPVLWQGVDFKTLATLFMLLTVLEGFKSENLFLPLLRLAGKMRSATAVAFFLVFGVFFSSMFVTNDVSLIIFVPLTILLFRSGGKEDKLLPVIILENIAAVRGSLLTPFGSPQNLYLFSQSGLSAGKFMGMMLPLWLGSGVLLVLFILFFFRKSLTCPLGVGTDLVAGEWAPARKKQRGIYLALFCLILITIVTRTAYWPYVTVLVTLVLLLFDRSVFRRVDYVLLFTFFCFFVFSSSVSGNPAISTFLSKAVAGREYWWSLGLSQIISNVPASIVLWPFTENLKALLYGLDTAGLVFIIGSLASVIALRLYTREYPGKGKAFFGWFELISLAFFAIVLLPQYFLCR